MPEERERLNTDVCHMPPSCLLPGLILKMLLHGCKNPPSAKVGGKFSFFASLYQIAFLALFLFFHAIPVCGSETDVLHTYKFEMPQGSDKWKLNFAGRSDETLEDDDVWSVELSYFKKVYSHLFLFQAFRHITTEPDKPGENRLSFGFEAYSRSRRTKREFLVGYEQRFFTDSTSKNRFVSRLRWYWPIHGSKVRIMSMLKGSFDSSCGQWETIIPALGFKTAVTKNISIEVYYGQEILHPTWLRKDHLLSFELTLRLR